MRFLLAECVSPGGQETVTETSGVHTLKNDQSRVLAMHAAALHCQTNCCQGVHLPQALLIKALPIKALPFLGSNHSDRHLMGVCSYPQRFGAELPSGHRPRACDGTSSGAVTNPKGDAGDRHLTISTAAPLQYEPKTCSLD